MLNFPNAYADKKYNNDPTLHGPLPIMRAKVINNNDPKKIGRVMIRIPSYHGVPGLTDRYIEDEKLPWAMPCFYGGCGQDMGSFLVPIPGTFIWVLFEDNDVSKPVYLGGIPSIGSKLSKQVNNLGDPTSPQDPWFTTPNMADAPWDTFDGKATGVPERQVIYKSQKGHTIMCDDTDGEESLTILDRVGQVIKFFCGVTKAKNRTKYRRELKSAENNTQLGDGLTGEPSIMLRSGETPDGGKIHSMIQMYRDHMRGESINSDTMKRTTTDYSPIEYNQQTQSSTLNMTEDHIYISYPEILEYFCSDHYRLTAFGKSVIECTRDHIKVQFDGNGLYIDGDAVKLFYKDTVIMETSKELNAKASTLFNIQAAGSEISGDEDGLKGKAKEFKFEGSGSVYTEGGKTYIVGTEVHMNRS